MMQERALAKVNLFLHLTGKQADGFHTLESLVAFAEVADVLEVQPAPTLSLTIDGPFAQGLAADDSNLVLRAARAIRRECGVQSGAALRLTKNLPVAAGIGGGSADAAAALRLLLRLWGGEIVFERLLVIAASLSSDVPACISSCAAWASGIGTQTDPLHFEAKLPVLLVNPGVSVSTAEAYRRVTPPYSSPLGAWPKFSDAAALLEWLARQRNDLYPAAVQIAPEIDGVLQALSAQAGCVLSRLSGSGATCFGIFESAAACEEAARALNTHSGWWVQPTTLVFKR